MFNSGVIVQLYICTLYSGVISHTNYFNSGFIFLLNILTRESFFHEMIYFGVISPLNILTLEPFPH